MKPPKKSKAETTADAMDELVEEVMTDADANPLEAQVVELTNDLQRTRADFENYRKQVEAQKLQSMSAAKLATIEKFLPLLDDIDRAISAYSEQLSPLRKTFDKTLTSLGLTRINSDVDTEFNPDFHEAISVEGDDGENEVISETLRPGYLYDDNVVRPAMVKVKKISAAHSDTPDADADPDTTDQTA